MCWTHAMAELLIDKLTVTYPTPRGPVDVVRSLSMQMGSERIGIVGESGSGKSMTARAILGLVRAPGMVQAGRMLFDGNDLTRQTTSGWRQLRGKRIGMILQDPKFSLNPVLPVGRQIAEAGLLHGVFSKREAGQRVSKGDRLRVYAVLAEIRAAQGDAKQADLFRGAVAAIRLSEQADDLHGLGLLKRAIALYEESLKLFADAYCIQSRLAIQMADLGLFDEAEAHYRKAYELMPDSFGRIESHCFGCERAFSGERAQSLAEKVFTKLVQERPEKPQIHYLIGYLREQQGRYAEAVKSMKEAVRLDPDYLNAWVKLSNIGERIAISTEDRAAAATALIRLDPLAKRHSFSRKFSGDLRQIHAALKKAAHLQPKLAKDLFALAASKKRLEENEKKMTPEMKAMKQIDPAEFLQERTQRFGAILMADPAVAFAARLISGGRSSFY